MPNGCSCDDRELGGVGNRDEIPHFLSHNFLAHNSKDKSVVGELARRLEERDTRVWLGEDQRIPG